MAKTNLNEVRFGLLRRLAEDPTLSQRDLARQMDVSVGRVNYCIRALIEKGEIKVNNFRHQTPSWPLKAKAVRICCVRYRT